MYNFDFQNPVRLIFGRDTILKLKEILVPQQRILLLYGGGSIKNNGVYENVMQALSGYDVHEFGGIEANPEYSTLMRAVEKVQREKIDFLLSVGGGSVLDGTKFIAAASVYYGDSWEMVTSRGKNITNALPLGCVLTLPATGSEMNINAVVSRKETGEKLAFMSPYVYPQFSILDPTTTFTLPERQTANGIVDAFAHVMEQYVTFDVNAPIQDGFAETLLRTLIQEGPKVMENPQDYDARANVMYAATMALNRLIGMGVPQDWATHQIGHELTAMHGIDHARTLSIIMPALLKHQKDVKSSKLIKFARNVWGITTEDDDAAIDQGLEKMMDFFYSLGMPIYLADINLKVDDVKAAADTLDTRGWILGEHQAIGKKEILEIFQLAS